MADDNPLTDSPRPPISSPANNASQQQQQQDAARARRQRQNLTAARMRQQQDLSGMVIDSTGERIRDKFYKFLTEYVEDETGEKYYGKELAAMEEAESTTMNINWNHLAENYRDLAGIPPFSFTKNI